MRDVWAIRIQTLDVVTNECRWKHIKQAFRTRRGAIRHLVRNGWELYDKNMWTFDAMHESNDRRYIRYAYVERIENGNMW